MKKLRIKDICDKGSSNLKQKDVEGKVGRYPVYGASGIISHIDSYHQENNYIAIVKDGSGIGRVTFMPAKSSVIGTMQYILPKEGFNINYIGYCLQSLDLSKYKQGAAIPHIYFRDYGERIVKVTEDLNEQQSIVNYLDSAFAKIDALKANAEKALGEAKALFQASLKEMLEPKEGWEEKKLEDITEVKDGTHDSPKYATEGIPFVTQKNITINGFDLLNTKKITLEDHKRFYARSNVEFGDIIIAMIGANRGMSCIVDTREVFSIKNVGLIKKSDNINSKYLLFYLHSPAANAYVLNNSNGGAQEFIGLKGLRNFPIQYPPLSEQQSIVATLDSLKSKVDCLQENCEKISKECDALKQAMLREIFE